MSDIRKKAAGKCIEPELRGYIWTRDVMIWTFSSFEPNFIENYDSIRIETEEERAIRKEKEKREGRRQETEEERAARKEKERREREERHAREGRREETEEERRIRKEKERRDRDE